MEPRFKVRLILNVGTCISYLCIIVAPMTWREWLFILAQSFRSVHPTWRERQGMAGQGRARQGKAGQFLMWWPGSRQKEILEKTKVWYDTQGCAPRNLLSPTGLHLPHLLSSNKAVTLWIQSSKNLAVSGDTLIVATQRCASLIS